MSVKKSLIIFLFGLFCFGCEKITSEVKGDEVIKIEPKNTTIQKSSENCSTFNFHYLETRNILNSPTVRHVEIFLDVQAFSEENLKTLFAHISEKNPEPQRLIIEVYTDWKQLDFPSDCPGTGSSNMPARPDEYDYLQAIYQRGAKSEYFQYSPEIKVDRSKFKKVVLRNEAEKTQ